MKAVATNFPKLSEIERLLSTAQGEEREPINFALCRNITLDLIAPYLRYFAHNDGLNANIRMGEFDNVMQEVLEPSSILYGDTDFILLFVHLSGLSHRLVTGLAGMNLTEVEAEMDAVAAHIRSIVGGIREHTDSPVLWHGFDMPIHSAFGIADPALPNGIRSLYDRLNQMAVNVLGEFAGAYFVDLENIRASLGSEQFYDRRLWHIARAPYSSAALAKVAETTMRFVRVSRGRMTKCIVLDCDNILWGGIVGEDGLAGIKLERAHPGSQYIELQETVLELSQRGIIVALCSKNNEADVIEVFENHPDMVLRLENISARRINWTDKATNIREIADELNIGLDAIAFVDDNLFEIGLVNQALPEVKTIHIEGPELLSARDKLLEAGLFDILTLSDDDALRSKSYVAEAARRSTQSRHINIESYLNSLNIKVVVEEGDALSLSRAAQLTQKTNQFNLTTRRYSEAEIKSLANDTTSRVFLAKASDRFGDYGTIGAAIVIDRSEYSEIDTFLLSCRALGRGIEIAFLRALIDDARSNGDRPILAKYIPTPKNGQVADFFPRCGFRKDADNAGDSESFILEYGNPGPEVPDSIEILGY